MEKLREIRVAIELKKESLPPEAFRKIESSLNALEKEFCSFPSDDSLLVFVAPDTSHNFSDLIVQIELLILIKKISIEKEWQKKWECYMDFYNFILMDKVFDYFYRHNLLFNLYLNISELKRSKVPRSKEDDINLFANQLVVLSFLE